MRRILGCLIAFLGVFAIRADAQCCGGTPRSLLASFLDADVVAVCRFQNAVRPNNALPKGQVELTLDDVLVPHAAIKGRKSIVISRYLEPGKERFLVAMDIDNGAIEPYRGVVLDAQGEMERFVRGAVFLKDKSQLGRTRYAVDFLLSPNKDVAESAHIEVGRAGYADFRKVAQTLNPDPWFKAIQDSKAPTGFMGTYAMLLAHCGKKENAPLLRKLVDDPQRMKFGTHALLLAYVLLDRENGWPLVAKTIQEKDTPFLARYSALQTVRLLYEERTDVVNQKKCLAAIASVLNVPDMADFAVEDFRKWERWEYCQAILDLPARAGFDKPIIRKAVLRFALQCPSPAAKTFVIVERARDPEWVSDTEELLVLEKEVKGPPKK